MQIAGFFAIIITSMKIFKGVGDFFGLDIGNSSVRVVQLSQHGTGANRAFALRCFGYASIDAKNVDAGSEAGRKRLGEIILTAVGQAGIKTKNVALGVPSSKTFTTVIDLPLQSKEDLAKVIKYQADQYIPMSSTGAKVDWAPLGLHPQDSSRQEVLLTSVSSDYVEERMEFIESLGFNVVAIEPDQVSMIRSLSLLDANSVDLIIDMGDKSTDVAVIYNNSPRLVRSLPVGLASIVRTASQNLEVKEDQARQFVLKFGLEPDKLEGRIYHAIEDVLENFASELKKTINFFQTKYTNINVTRIIVSGYAGNIPMLNNYIANKTNLPTTTGNPWSTVTMTAGQQQVIQSVASEFAVAVGLAQRSDDV